MVDTLFPPSESPPTSPHSPALNKPFIIPAPSVNDTSATTPSVSDGPSGYSLIAQESVMDGSTVKSFDQPSSSASSNSAVINTSSTSFSILPSSSSSLSHQSSSINDALVPLPPIIESIVHLSPPPPLLPQSSKEATPPPAPHPRILKSTQIPAASMRDIATTAPLPSIPPPAPRATSAPAPRLGQTRASANMLKRTTTAEEDLTKAKALQNKPRMERMGNSGMGVRKSLQPSGSLGLGDSFGEVKVKSSGLRKSEESRKINFNNKSDEKVKGGVEMGYRERFLKLFCCS